MEPAVLDKIAVARRQLVTAIDLHFSANDAVSVFSLASNACEIIESLCTLAGIDSFARDTRRHIPESKDLKRDYVNTPYRNFFKHADRDPNATLQGFSDSVCDHMLFLAVEDYLRLRKRAPIEVQVYQLWYLALYPEKVRPSELTRVLEPVERALPEIRSKSRPEKLNMGKALVDSLMRDPELVSHPQTEPSK
jgi:hypothetical protein